MNLEIKMPQALGIFFALTHSHTHSVLLCFVLVALQKLTFSVLHIALGHIQMLEASLYISEHLPDGATGLWAVVHCASWVALGELEWIPFAVLRKSIDINLLGE